MKITPQPVSDRNGSTAGNTPGRPNILYIFTDQQWAGAMSCTANPDISTPALDSLAASGVRFDRAYCTCPVCSPSRASMISGLMPHQHGVVKNDARIAREHTRNCLEHILGARGYECAYAGKWHIGHYNGISPEESKQHPYEVLANWEGDDPIAGVTDACVRFLSTKHENPFLLVVSYDCPHQICGWRNQEKGLQPESTGSCPDVPANFGIPENEASVLRGVYLDRHPEQQRLNPESWRHYRWAYYRYVELADQAVGKIIKALQENGLRENTLVVFSSDHGDGMGAHQWLGKCCHYDEVVRVPFIMSFPGRIPPGVVDNTRLISSGLDFYATALDCAGVPVPELCRGCSILPQSDQTARWRDQVVSEIWVAGPGSGNAWDDNPFGRMLCTGHYKYVIYDCGQHREQLFDQVNDPLEMINLAQSGGMANVIAEHRERLRDWCHETDDHVGITMLDSLVVMEK